MEKLEFKLLTLITVLAENHLAYRGSLSDMCEFFGCKTKDSRNNQRIRDAIDSLCGKGFIRAIQDGRVWTLTLDQKAKHRAKVIRIRKDWVMAAKAYKEHYEREGRESPSVDWSAILKVWLFLIGNHKEIITSSDIANKLAVSRSVVTRARRVLLDINAINVHVINEKQIDGSYLCLGSNIVINAWIDN